MSDKIRKIVENYCDREQRKYTPKKKKNSKPELEVEKALAEHWRKEGFFMKKYESKAVLINGVWRQPALSKGTPDWMGCSPDGVYVVSEVKAPGRRSTLRIEQRDFLVEVIKRGGFGICCDSVEYFKKHYKYWSMLNRRIKKDYLLALLPGVKREKTIGSLLACASDLSSQKEKQSD